MLRSFGGHAGWRGMVMLVGAAWSVLTAGMQAGAAWSVLTAGMQAGGWRGMERSLGGRHGGHAGWLGMVMPVGAACPARIGHASILYDPTF